MSEQVSIPVPGLPGTRILVTIELVTDEPQDKPRLDEVAELLRAGATRQQIAERFGRPVRSIDRWVAQARALYPDLPPARRGRAARKTPAATADGTTEADASPTEGTP